MSFRVLLLPDVDRQLADGPEAMNTAFDAVELAIGDDPWCGHRFRVDGPATMRSLTIGPPGDGFIVWVVIEHAREVHVVHLTWFG